MKAPCGAAALQGEIDRLARAASALPGCERPPPRSSRLERIGNDICEQNGKHSRRGVVGMSSGGTCDMVAGLLHCNIYYGIAAMSEIPCKAIKIRACRKPNPRASKLRGGGPSFPAPTMTTTAARPMPWRSPRRCALERGQRLTPIRRKVLAALLGQPQAARRLRDHRATRAHGAAAGADHRLPRARVPARERPRAPHREPQCFRRLRA